MQFAVAALMKLGTAMGIGGTAAAGAAAGGSTVASILSGGATALSILYGLSSANEAATSMELSAKDAELEIAGEDLQGLQRRNALKTSLLDSLGEMDAAYAASGVDLSFGTPSQARKEAMADADRALTLDAMTTMQRGARLQERAKMYRIGARSKRGGALAAGIAKGADFATSLYERG